MTPQETIKALISGISNELAQALIEQSQAAILDYTRRTTMIAQLEPVSVDYAVVLYNRIGVEGETSRSEGGISHSFTNGFPDDIKSRMNPYIKARVVGNAV